MIPDKLYVGGEYSFQGRVRRKVGSDYVAVDIAADAVTLIFKETDDPTEEELITAAADCATSGDEGLFNMVVSSVDTADLTANVTYFYELYWTPDGGEPKVLEKGKVKARARLYGAPAE